MNSKQMKPNKARIRKWVNALRSGQYKQANGTLREGQDTFCCLGVACEISGLSEWKNVVPGDPDYMYAYLGDTQQMPVKVANYFGLDEGNPYIVLNKKGDEEGLAQLNDGGKSFKQIANLIEKNFLAPKKVVKK